MADIFVSYSKADRAAVERLIEAIEAHGFSVWWDTSLKPNDEFSGVIEAQIIEAKAAIVCWSASAVKSQWVGGEAKLASKHGRYIGCTLDHHEPPLPFNNAHAVSLKRWSGDAADRDVLVLLSAVERLTGGIRVTQLLDAHDRRMRESQERKRRAEEVAHLEAEQRRQEEQDRRLREQEWREEEDRRLRQVARNEAQRAHDEAVNAGAARTFRIVGVIALALLCWFGWSTYQGARPGLAGDAWRARATEMQRTNDTPLDFAKFTADGSRFVALDGDGGAAAFEVRTGREIWRGDMGRSVVETADDVARRRRSAIIGSRLESYRGDNISVWVPSFAPENFYGFVELSADGGQAATVDEAGELTIWDVARNAALRRQQLPAETLNTRTDYALSPDLSLLCVELRESLDQTRTERVLIWSTTDGRAIATLAALGCHDVAFSRDGEMLVVTNSETFSVFSAGSGATLFEITDLNKPLLNPAYPKYIGQTADGCFLVSDRVGNIRVVAPTTGDVVMVLNTQRQTEWPNFLTWRYGLFGDRLASLSPDGTQLALVQRGGSLVVGPAPSC